jgi:hypothetical protein
VVVELLIPGWGSLDVLRCSSNNVIGSDRSWIGSNLATKLFMDLLLILWCVELSVLLLSFLLIICASYSALVRVPHVLNYAMLLAEKLIIAVRYVSLRVCNATYRTIHY